jgi:hypothetical protein
MENFCTNIRLVLNCFVVIRSKLWLIAFFKIHTYSGYFGGHKTKFLHKRDDDSIRLKYSLQNKGANYCTIIVLDSYFYSFQRPLYVLYERQTGLESVS